MPNAAVALVGGACAVARPELFVHGSDGTDDANTCGRRRRRAVARACSDSAIKDVAARGWPKSCARRTHSSTQPDITIAGHSEMPMASLAGFLGKSWQRRLFGSPPLVGCGFSIGRFSVWWKKSTRTALSSLWLIETNKYLFATSAMLHFTAQSPSCLALHYPMISGWARCPHRCALWVAPLGGCFV